MPRNIIVLLLSAAVALVVYWALPASNLARSQDDILLGQRMFEGDMQHDRLVMSASAVTFVNADDPATYVPYNFAFDGTKFIEIPDTGAIAQFQQLLGVNLPTANSVDLESCTQPRPETIATQDGISLIFPTLCRINAAVEGGPGGMIGVILPVAYRSLELDGDAVCRTEAAHWRTLEGFADPAIVLCAIVDRPFIKGQPVQLWMDVILYQQYAGKLYTMRAESRNFQRIQ